MGNEEMKKAVLEWFKAKSAGGKTKWYLRDVVKAMEEKGYAKRDVQKVVTDCVTEESLMYWSSGSSTMLVLPENFPKSVT